VEFLKSINWKKILGNVAAGAATGYASTGLWQGAVAGAAMAVIGLVQQQPTSK
jgi:hypothetical protein